VVVNCYTSTHLCSVSRSFSTRDSILRSGTKASTHILRFYLWIQPHFLRLRFSLICSSIAIFSSGSSFSAQIFDFLVATHRHDFSGLLTFCITAGLLRSRFFDHRNGIRIDSVVFCSCLAPEPDLIPNR
jgi:hypothetical protein